MELQRTRIFLLLSLFVVGLMLYSAWQQEHSVSTVPASTQPAVPHHDVPSAEFSSDLPSAVSQSVPQLNPRAVQASGSEQQISIQTDVFNLKIDLVGGDIVFANLPKYPVSLDSPDVPYQVLDQVEDKRYYIMQTGLIGQNDTGPDSRGKGRARYQSAKTQYVLQENQDSLEIPLRWEGDGILVHKIYTFKRDSYLVSVRYEIENTTDQAWQANLFGQIKRQQPQQKRSMFSVQMYQGAAVYTPEKPYKKISFSDMKDTPFKQKIEGGWAAMLERYFVAAWVPDKSSENKFYTRADENEMYTIGTIAAYEVPARQTMQIGGQIYVGPEKTDVLKQISSGLELTVDYGILWPISQLLFWLLKYIFDFVGNWGWSIILLTLLIKLAFYKLSAASYKSMARLKDVQPRIEALKARCGEDKQQFSQGLLELYRKEKINPLGGCLPILIQIPVFIALYYVLLESVELRQAPFMFWITDLSIKDPFYVLPIIMGISMFVQQKMNPPPPDPMQAKVMMSMPFIFTLLFLSFPSGLVLYWVVNNLLSMLQQWYINQKFGLNTRKPKATPKPA